MDFKRLLVALSLSFIFIWAWQKIFMPPIQSNDTKQVDVNSIVGAPKKETSIVQQDIYDNMPQIDLNDTIIMKTDLMSLVLTFGGTSIRDLRIMETIDSASEELKHQGAWNYKTGKYENYMPVELMNLQRCNPCLVEDEKYIYFDKTNIVERNNKKIKSVKNGVIKTTLINDTSYVIEHIFTGLEPTKNYSLIWADGLNPTEQNIKDDLAMLTIFSEEKTSYDEETINEANKLFTYNNIGWAGLKTKYFMKAITNKNYKEKKIDTVEFISETHNNDWNQDFIYSTMQLKYGKGNDSIHTYSYIGPIDTKHLQNHNTSHLVQLFGFGWWIIGYLGQLILWALTSLYSIIPNYGVICILFAFIIRLFTGPLTKQSFLSNQKMQTLQPKIKKLQEKYKSDQGKLSQATMELYKKEGVNPIGGCLPILVQMPLLFALFQVFRKTIEFRGAEFLPIWITDLSQPDIILQFKFLETIPGINYFFGHGIALLPIIMGVIMFLSMKMSSTSTEPSQKFAMYFMNAFFVLLFNTFPSGLNLYYTMYNILNFIQQRQLKQLQS